MAGRTDSRLRLLLLLGGFAIFAGVLGLRLAYWQLGQASELRRQADAQLARPVSDEIRRGDITDRRGRLLATTAYRDRLAAHPDLLEPDERTEMARRLAALLELDDQQEQDLVERFESGAPYVIVSRRLSELQSQLVREQLASGQLAALSLEPHAVRFYPNLGGSPGTTLASQLLGFVTEDGQGQYGVERQQQEVLAGRSGVTAAVDDAPLPAIEGGSVQLTIDASLQLRLEKELYAAWVANRAERVSGIVVDPYTGAVLAWASVPGYDANSYADIARRSPERFADPIANQIYEPGSVMKMFTAAAALEQGVVTPQSVVRDGKVLRFGETVEVRNFDRRSMGEMTFEDAIAYSRNVATGRVAMVLGDTTNESAAVLYEMWQRLGVGRPTGIELTNEAGGLVTDPTEQQWHDVDLVNRAFGQGVAVTPLQLAVAFSAMANGGTLVEPHLFAAINGQEQASAEGQPVLAPSLSEQLREMMVHVVETVPSYAEATLIPGYVVGGKTGTAQIWDAEARAWKERIYNHTFAGFVGRERPDAVIVVRIHEAEPSVKRRFGYVLQLTSNELFRRVAQDVIEVFDLAPLASTSGEPSAEQGHQPSGDDGGEALDEPTEEGNQPESEADASRRP